MTNRLGWIRRPWTGAVAGVAALALVLSSCSLDVFDPDVVSPDDVSDPASLPIAVTGAIGDLQFALDDYALYSGLFTDEFLLAGTFPTRQEVDERRINFTNTTLNTELYELMHSSRFSADNLVASAQSLVGNEEADQDRAHEDGAEQRSFLGLPALGVARPYLVRQSPLAVGGR